jgi:hypothetical protein
MPEPTIIYMDSKRKVVPKEEATRVGIIVYDDEGNRVEELWGYVNSSGREGDTGTEDAEFKEEEHPRDDGGKFSTGGGGGGKAPEVAPGLKPHEVMKNPNFRKWFRSSKIVDENGNPLVVYHGTTAKEDFSEFVPKYNRKEQIGFGISFTPDASFASGYGGDPDISRNVKGAGRVYPVMLRIENPLDLTVTLAREGTPEFELAKKLVGKKLVTDKDENGVRVTWLQGAVDTAKPEVAQRILQEAGYDGVIYESERYTRTIWGKTNISKAITYTVFSPTQIKSVYNKGTFNPETAKISDEFKEEEHPRDKDGKFKEGAGEGKKPLLTYADIEKAAPESLVGEPDLNLDLPPEKGFDPLGMLMGTEEAPEPDEETPTPEGEPLSARDKELATRAKKDPVGKRFHYARDRIAYMRHKERYQQLIENKIKYLRGQNLRDELEHILVKEMRSAWTAVRLWQGNTQGPEPMALKFASLWVETPPEGVISRQVLVKEREKEAYTEFAKDFKDKFDANSENPSNYIQGRVFDCVTKDQYLRMRALNQAYMEHLGEKQVTLYRGTNGDTGPKLVKELREAVKAGETDFVFPDSAIAGYSSSKSQGESWGKSNGGITVTATVPAHDIIVHEKLLCDLTNVQPREHEYLVSSGERVWNIVEDLDWTGKADDLSSPSAITANASESELGDVKEWGWKGEPGSDAWKDDISDLTDTDPGNSDYKIQAAFKLNIKEMDHFKTMDLYKTWKTLAEKPIDEFIKHLGHAKAAKNTVSLMQHIIRDDMRKGGK